MTASPAHPSRGSAVVVSDTGPLLCAGGISGRDGVELLTRRFSTKGIDILVPTKVQGELHGLSQRTDAVGIAATRMRNERNLHFDSTNWPQPQRDSVRREVERRVADRNRRQGRPAAPDPSKNAGEVDAILLAQHHGALLLCNDRPAAQVARARGLTVVKFADLLRASMAAGEIGAGDVDQYLNDLDPQHFYVGMRNATAVTINALPVVPGL